MITHTQVDRLLQFQNGEYLITSCYLNLDRARWPVPMLKIRVKDLLQSAQQDLSAKAGSHAQRESLLGDLKRIEEFVMPEIVGNHHKALAIFSCTAHKFWQTYGLPGVVRNILIADREPYIRPLTAILAEHHRFCVALVDRVVGHIYEVYMDEIVERTDIIDEVPRRVKEGGLGGRDERNIERHHAQAVRQHFQRLADAMFDLFKRDKFDYLVLGGHHEVLREFKQLLHPYLAERWAGDFHAEPARVSLAEVLKCALEIEEQVERDYERRLAEELVRKVETGNRAVRGVSATLEALTQGAAETLLVEEGFETPGFVCFSCHFASLDEGTCPRCHQPLEPCPDIVDEAIELALRKNCQIEHVRGLTALRDAGRMGAILRFQV